MYSSKLSHYRRAGSKGERRIGSYSFLISALDDGSLPPVSIVQKAGWASELVWTQMLVEKSFPSAGDRTLVVQPIVRQYYAASAP
jgi:hypothetical protein